MQRALCPLRLVPGSSQMLFFLLFPCSNTQMDSTVLWVSVIFINFLRLSIYVYFEGALRLCVPCLGSFDSHTVQFVSARQTWAVMDSSLCAGRFDFPSWRSFMEATVGSTVLTGRGTLENFQRLLARTDTDLEMGGYSEIELPTSSNDFKMIKPTCFITQWDTEMITVFLLILLAL